jgi:hypothetical protein
MWTSTVMMAEALDKIIDQVLLSSVNEVFQQIREPHTPNTPGRTSALQGLGELLFESPLEVPNVALPVNPLADAQQRILTLSGFPQMVEIQMQGGPSCQEQLTAIMTENNFKNRVNENQKKKKGKGKGRK